jgi:hypothetical protein
MLSMPSKRVAELTQFLIFQALQASNSVRATVRLCPRDCGGRVRSGGSPSDGKNFSFASWQGRICARRALGMRNRSNWWLPLLLPTVCSYVDPLVFRARHNAQDSRFELAC